VSYCLDTSALLDGWVRYYPPDNFPSFWAKMDELVKGGKVWACRQVLEELRVRDDDVYAWLKQRSGIVVEIDESRFALAQAISVEFPGWADRKRSGADPFVVALAEQRGLRVITGERLVNTLKGNKTKIPDVCRHRKVGWGAVVDLIRAEGWKF
jgi:hypothetical protein